MAPDAGPERRRPARAYVRSRVSVGRSQETSDSQARASGNHRVALSEKSRCHSRTARGGGRPGRREDLPSDRCSRPPVEPTERKLPIAASRVGVSSDAAGLHSPFTRSSRSAANPGRQAGSSPSPTRRWDWAFLPRCPPPGGPAIHAPVASLGRPMAAVRGTARSAPVMPPTAAPPTRLTTTRNGGTPMVLRMTKGTRMLPSTTWITT